MEDDLSTPQGQKKRLKREKDNMQKEVAQRKLQYDELDARKSQRPQQEHGRNTEEAKQLEERRLNIQKEIEALNRMI